MLNMHAQELPLPKEKLVQIIDDILFNEENRHVV